MSWLNSFDPAAPKSSPSSSTNQRPHYVGSNSAGNQSRNSRAATTSNSLAGPSALRSNNAAPSQVHRAPAQTGRTTPLFDSSSSTRSGAVALQARPPRPPHRIKAAPPSASLRSEDAQPNENEIRTKSWEIAGPPTIGKAKPSRSMRPPRLPSQAASLQAPKAAARRWPPPEPSAHCPSQGRPTPGSFDGQPAPRSERRPHLQTGINGPQHGTSHASPLPQPKPIPQSPSYPAAASQSQAQISAQPKTSLAPKPQQSKKLSITKARKLKGKAKLEKKRQKEQRKQLEQRQKSESTNQGGSKYEVADSQPPSKRMKREETEKPKSMDAHLQKPNRPTNAEMIASHLQAARPNSSNGEPQSSESVRTPSPPPVHARQEQTIHGNTQPDRKPQSSASGANISSLAQLRSILSMVNKSPEAPEKISSRPLHGSSLRAAQQVEEARQAEELAQYLDQLTDDESSVSIKADPAVVQAASGRAPDSLTDAISRSEPPANLGGPFKEGKTVESSDDEDDLPLAERVRAAPCTGTLASLTSRSKQLNSDESDPDEDIPLQDLLRQRPSEATSSASSSTEVAAKWCAPFSPKVARIFHGARGLSMKFVVPIASSALEGQDRARARSRAAAFDAAIGVSEQGRIVTFSEQPTNRAPGSESDLPSHMMRFPAQDLVKRAKAERSSLPIDRVEDVSRLTSKVCGIASSTDKPLGLGNHDEYPCQVSLVTVDDTARTHRTYHLDERPHTWGVASISHFPRTDPKDASSIDFATGGIDGIVNHWHWRSRSTKAETFRLHTLHDSKPIVALQHLSSRSNILASASIGTVIGYDLAALTLGFSWNTSDHIVHLERTPDPRLMLGVVARRDYDQFRLFDITGRNGAISRPAISFGWLNDSQGTLPLGRGSFHPIRRAIFAHGGEDGRVRVWDIRNARDPLIDERLADGPIVETVWAGSGKQGGEEDADRLYVATPKGVGSVSILAP